MVSLVGQVIFTEKELQALVVSRSIEDAKRLENAILKKFGIREDNPTKYFFLKNVTFVSYEEAMDYNPTHVFFDKATDIPEEKLFEIFNFYYDAICKFVLCGFNFHRESKNDKDVWKFFWNDPMNRTYVVSLNEKPKRASSDTASRKYHKAIDDALLMALAIEMAKKTNLNDPPGYFPTPFWC